MKIGMAMLGLITVLGILGCGRPTGPKPLVVGMDLSYPPFETINNQGEPMGVSVELAQGLADAIGRPLKIENIPFVGLIPSLQGGRLDCVISSMTVTEERKQSIGFSDPYLKTGLGILAGAGSDIERVVDEPGRTYVVRQGTTGEVWARKNLKNANILSVEKENAAVLEVIQGKADGFIYDQMSVWSNWQQHPDRTRALLTPLQIEEWAVAMRKDDLEMTQSVNDFLKAFRAAGGFDRLSETYLFKQKQAFDNQGIPFIF